MDGSCDILKEEWLSQNASLGQENEHSELHSPEADTDDVMENNKRLMCGAGTGDSEQVKDREAGCVKAEQHFNKNGVIMCSFENVDRKCGHAENITLTEKGDEVARAHGHHSLAEMAVRENVGDVNNQRCLNEDVISNSQDGLCIGGKVDNTYNVENTEIEGQDSNILGTNSVGMNGSENDSSLLVPSSTDENICAEINVLKMTCSSNVCPLEKESLKQENGQQGGKEDSCINESPPLVHFTTTEDAKNSLKFSESVCNNSDYLVDKEATFGNGDSLMDKETLKQEKILKDNIDAPYNDNVHPVDTDPCNDSAHPVDIDPTYSNVHPVDTDPTCNDSLHSMDTDSTCNDSLHPVDTDPTCNDSLHSMDTDPTCNDSLHSVDTDSTCNDSLHSVDTDSTCNDSLHSVDTDPTCNDSLHSVDSDSTCNDSLHPVDTDSTCNDSLHSVDTDSTCNDSLHSVDTDLTCNDSLHPVDTDSTCNGNVHVIDNEASRKENVGRVMGDNCINEILQFAPLTANDNAKDSAGGEVQISKATSNDRVCDVEKETSKRESDQQDGLQVNTDDSLSLDLSAGSETTKNCFLQINAEIDGSPSLDLSTAKETKSFSCCESSVSKVNFDNSVCVAMKETSSQEIDQENCVKTNTYTSKGSPLVHLDKDENVQTLATDEKNIPKATFNDCVSFKENETLSLANDQQSDPCMSSSPVPLDTNKISETLKCDASSISKDTFCDKSLSMHEESLQKQEMLNQGINKTNSDLQSSIFISCEHSISLEKEDVNLKELDGVGTGDHKVVTDLVRENCSTDIEVDTPESPVTVDKTACSESLAEDLSETLITVNKTVHRGNVEVAISESQIRLSKTVQSSTGDVPELLKTVSKTVHSDSSGEDILEPSITSTKIVQSTTIELDVPESLKTVHSESVVKDIPEMLRIISKTEPFGSIEEDEDGAVQIVDITVDSESVEENSSDSPKTFNKTAQGEDVAGDICELLKKSYKKAMSKKKKRMKEKKGHKKKSKRKQESEKIAENLRFVEVSRDVDSAEEVRMGEVVEGRSIIYNRLYDERTLVNTYEELLDQEVENQEMDGLRELEEMELIKERRKKAKKKKKSRRRRVATVEEGDVGDNASHRFPTYLDGFFLQYDEGNEELGETVEDASLSFDIQARMLNSEERIYPRHFSFESEDSVKSGNCIDSVKNRYEELESRRRKKHDKREHKERKRKKARSNSREARPEREHFMTLTARREHMFDRERNRSARDEERVRSSGRKTRRIEREMPDKDRRRVEVDEERRHSARSGSQDYRTVIAERSPAHSSQHRQRSESRGVANEMEQERGRGRAKHKDNNDAGRNSQIRGRNAENSHVESSQHRSERGSDKENNRRQRRRQMRTQQSNDLNSRDRIRNARREQARRTSVSSSSSISYEGIVRRRGDDSHCIIISQENSDDDGASSDVILVETERIVINLDDEEDAPPSRVRIINRGGRNPAITRKANRKSARSPSELSASLGHSVQSNNSTKRPENVRNKSKRRELPAAPTSDRSTIEVETLSVVASSAAYDPMHPTEEADECNFTHPAFSSSRIPASPIVERGPVSPDSPAPRGGRPSTPPLPVVTKADKTASSMPSQPTAGRVSSNLSSAPAFLTQTQSQQQALMPLSSHLGSEVEQSAHFPSRSLKSSLSPNKQLPNGGLTSGFPAIQQSLFPSQDTVQLLPLQNSRQPLPFNTVIPPFLPPPPPPPFGVCLEADQHLPVPTLNQFSQLASTQPSLEASQLLPVSPMNQFSQHASTQPSLEASQHLQVPTLNQFSQHASLQPNLEASHLVPVSPVNQFSQLASMQLNVEASQHLPVSPMNQFTQLACTQPIMERHNIDSHRDNQDIFQPVEMVNSLHARVSLQPTLTDKSPLVGSLAADLSSSCSHSSQGHDGGDNVENTKAVDMDFSSEDDDYHLELLSPKANRKDSKRGRQQRQHSNLNQGASSGNSCNPGSSSDLSVKHGKTLRKDANKVASKEHLQVSQDKSKVHRGKKKRVENNVRGEDNYDDVPASAADLTCKEKFLKKLYFQERVIEEVKMAIKPFYSSKKITKEQYKVILRKAVPKVCHNKKGNINPQKILHLVEAYVRKMKGQGSTGGKKRQQVQHRGVEKHSAKDKNASAAVKHNGDRTFGLVR